MSESTGPHALNNAKGFRSDSAGKTVPGCRTVISNPDADGNGEVFINNGQVDFKNRMTTIIITFYNLHTLVPPRPSWTPFDARRY